MALPASLSCSEHLVEGQHDIAQMKAQVSNHCAGLLAKQARDFYDASSLASTKSTASHHSSIDGRSPKDQLYRCLERYQTLARDDLNPDSVKEGVFWCCLGLGVGVSFLPASPTQRQSPLSAESRSDSNNSLATVSDSGFAPSVEIKAHHRLSVGDSDVENVMTNLVGGLVGAFVSGLLGHEDASRDLFLTGVGQDFDVALSRLGLSENQKIGDIAALAAKAAAQLLHVLQSGYDALCFPTADYWELCLKLVIASNEGDINTSNALRSQLIKHIPPSSLAEPALSYIMGIAPQDEPTDSPPFPTLDERTTVPHITTRFQRQTRSRAASLMSHSSLRSFSSIRSFGGLSAKSPASLSLSHNFGAGHSPVESPSPSGSFIIGSSATALGALNRLARSLQVEPRQRSSLSPIMQSNDYSVVGPESSRRSTLPTITRSASDYLDGSRTEGRLFSGSKGKGKENNAQLPREGLRPGVANARVRTGTRFVMTSPPTPSGLGHATGLPKMDPVLAALERSSKFKSKSVCLNCGHKGDNYPCCPRCREAWCSRECRLEANNGGKHVCKRAATLGP